MDDNHSSVNLGDKHQGIPALGLTIEYDLMIHITPVFVVELCREKAWLIDPREKYSITLPQFELEQLVIVYPF